MCCYQHVHCSSHSDSFLLLTGKHIKTCPLLDGNINEHERHIHAFENREKEMDSQLVPISKKFLLSSKISTIIASYQK